MHIFRAHCCLPSAPQPGESWGASSSGENLCPRPATGGNPLLRPLPQAVPGPASGSVLISPESPPCGHNLFKRSGHGTSASTFQPDLGVPTPHPPHAHPHGAETPTSDPGTRGRCPTPKRPPTPHSGRASANLPWKSCVLVPKHCDQTCGLTHTRGQPPAVSTRSRALGFPRGEHVTALTRASFRGMGGTGLGTLGATGSCDRRPRRGQQDPSHWAGPHLGAPPTKDAATRGRGQRCRGLRSQARPAGGALSGAARGWEQRPRSAPGP